MGGGSLLDKGGSSPGNIVAFFGLRAGISILRIPAPDASAFQQHRLSSSSLHTVFNIFNTDFIHFRREMETIKFMEEGIKKMRGEMEGALREKQGQIDQLTESLARVQPQINEMKNDLQAKQGQIDQLTQSLAAVEPKFIEMQVQFNEMIQTSSQMKVRVDQLENVRFNEMKAQFDEMQVRIDQFNEMKVQFGEMQGTIQQMKGLFNELEPEVVNWRKACDRVTSLEDKLGEVHIGLRAADAAVTQIRTQVNDIRARLPPQPPAGAAPPPHHQVGAPPGLGRPHDWPVWKEWKPDKPEEECRCLLCPQAKVATEEHCLSYGHTKRLALYTSRQWALDNNYWDNYNR